MDQNKWTKVDQNTEWTKLEQSRPNWIKLYQNELKWIDQIGPK